MGEVRAFPLPDLGEGLTEAEIVRWLVAVGDRVTVDQPVVEVTTEKAAVEVPTPFAGVVVTLHGAPGDLVPVGSPLISVDVGAAAGASTEPAAAAAASAAAPAAEVADSPEEARETAAASAQAAAAAAGPARSGAASAAVGAGGGESGNVLVGYGTSATVRRRRRAAATPAGGAADGRPRTAVSVPASPVVRRLAAEMGVALESVAATGPGGLVSRADLERHVAVAAPATVTAPAAAPPAPAAADLEGERVHLTGPRRVGAERLARSHAEVPDAATWLTVDATAMLALRDAMNARQSVVRVTPLALLLRLCVTALRRHPFLNGSYDAERGDVVLHPAIHLGVAVQTDRGLVVPVVRDADRRPALGIASELNRLAAAARDGSIAAREMTGSTFTVSNFGAFGVDGGIPIVNPPEAGILGVGAIAERPWVVNGGLAVRSVLSLSLAFDHRVCDGGVAGGFVRLLGDLVEDPGQLRDEDWGGALATGRSRG